MTRYVIGPDVAIRLAREEAVIRGEHQLLVRRFSARRYCHSSIRQFAAVR
jgi:hypothetical protein